MADQPAPPETVSITVDGVKIDARPGEMIIAAAERAGIYIPRFCYHPRMKPVGMCRMCLVDVKGPRGFALQPACFIPVAQDQEVVTTSPAVKKAQDGVLEFLLVNHPLDCPVCDKGGECPLQDQTLAFGPGESRFVEEKRHWEKPISLSELVLLDRERCIQCARCTRFADEVAGDALIDFAHRGDVIEVATFPDAPFSSYFSGNTVQICPVGALTASPYRFRARPWDIEQVESSCTSCAVGCRVAVQSSNDKLIRYLGIDADPVNWSWMCDKGRFDFEAVNSPERLTSPMVRKGDALIEVGWAEALGVVAGKVGEAKRVHGESSIGIIGGARLPNEDAYAWSKLARMVLGTDNVDAQLGDGLPAEAVLGVRRATIDEACSAGAVVLMGPDIKEELPVLYLRLRHAAVERGVKLIECAPACTGLSRYAATTLLYRPGEAARLARALIDADDPGADVAGVAAADVRGARQLLAGAGADVVVVLGRPSVADDGHSLAEAAAIFSERDGVRFLTALRRSNVHGALDMGLAPGVLPGRVSLEQARPWFEAAWGSGLPEQRGLDTTGMLTAASEAKLQALVLLGADPLSDFPDRSLARRGLDGAGFIVAVDCFLTESAKRADVVLPAATYAERPGTFTNLEGRISRLGQKITAPGQAWPDWMVAAELAFRLGQDLGFEGIDAIWDEIEAVAPSHQGVTRALLASRRARDGVVVPLSTSETALEPGTGRPGGGADVLEIVTDAGAGVTQAPPAPIDPIADPGIGSAETHGVPLTALDPGADEEPAAEVVHPEERGATRPALIQFKMEAAGRDVPALDSYSLRLVSPRTLWDRGTLVSHSPSLAGLHPALHLRANPYDLDRLGVGGSGRVRVISPHTSMVLDVIADHGVPRGSAALTFNVPVDGMGGGARAGGWTAGAAVPGEGAADLIDATSPVTDVRLESV